MGNIIILIVEEFLENLLILFVVYYLFKSFYGMCVMILILLLESLFVEYVSRCFMYSIVIKEFFIVLCVCLFFNEVMKLILYVLCFFKSCVLFIVLFLYMG